MKYFIMCAVIPFFFSGVTVGMTNTQHETSSLPKTGNSQKDGTQTVKDKQSLLGELRDYGHKKLSRAFEGIKAHPVLATGIAGTLCIFAYQRNAQVQAEVNKGMRSMKEFLKFKVLVPGYVKYEEMKEQGPTIKEFLGLCIALGAWWGIKKVHDTYNFIELTKQWAQKGRKGVENFWHDHPRIVLSTLGALGLAALTFRLYKAAALPLKTKFLMPMDSFLLRSGSKMRNVLFSDADLQNLITGDLTELIESESFNELMSTLSEEQQEYIYSLVEDYHAAAYEGV
jgi:hypothetical protein